MWDGSSFCFDIALLPSVQSKPTVPNPIHSRAMIVHHGFIFPPQMQGHNTKPTTRCSRPLICKQAAKIVQNVVI